MGIVEQLNEVLDELEERGIKYPDNLYIKVKTIRTTLDGWRMQMIGGNDGK